MIFDKVVILISGSGAQDRNSEILNHRPFLVLADYLTKSGIAVLRYDDRGVGGSGGNHRTATSADFANDTESAIQYLSRRPDMVNKQIGLIGHSEGGLIAPMVAAKNKDVDFVCLLAGPGIDISELMLLQNERALESQGINRQEIDKHLVRLEKIFNYVNSNPEMDRADLKNNLHSLFAAESDTKDKSKLDILKGQIAAITTPWFHYFIQYKPQNNLAKLTCPALAINGGKDVQVTAKENLDGIRTACFLGGNSQITIKEFQDLNHLFQMCETGSVDEYSKIEETFNGEAMEFIANWIIEL